MDSLTTRTARAVQWRFAGTFVGAASQLLVGVLLARLLTPADFGVTALAYVALGLAQSVADFGLGSAILRRAAVTDRHVRSAFTWSVLGGFSMAVVIAAAAPLAAAAMHDTTVTPVLRLLSVGIALRGTAVVADALLRRHLDFRRAFFIDTASYALGFGGVAVSLALQGYGVWSLVVGGLVQILTASIAQLAVVRHPVRPLLARRELGELLGFGVPAAVSGCVNYMALNGDYFVVGRLMGAGNLGLYVRAYGLMNLPQTYAAAVMSSVLFPAIAEVQHEPARVRAAYLTMTQLTAMIAAPSMTIVAIVAPHLVRWLYGPQWSAAVAPLQILSIAGYFRALYHLGGIVAQAVGRVYGELWRQLAYAALVVGGTVLGSRHGLPGVAVGVSVAILFMFVATGHLALTATSTPWRLYLRVQREALVTALVTGAVALVVRLLLEGLRASNTVITIGVLAAAAVPWSVGMIWTLRMPELEPLRESLPATIRRIVGFRFSTTGDLE
jgi:O-antigen/teichoic acid export membrane protein